MSTKILEEIIQAQKQGHARGIASICSAHPDVLRVVMQQAAQSGAVALVETTCNQVNQFGGYTGMTPKDFTVYLKKLADQARLAPEQLLLGGDHLGPSVWQKEPADSALEKSAVLIRAYIQAGYRKIHLDASMKLADDDPNRPLPVELAAQRSAFLASIAEQTCMENGLPFPRYVIGTEVPIPGGAQSTHKGLCITTPQDAQQTIEATRLAFEQAGLGAAWERVLAIVVQPGVEFGDEFVDDYQPERAKALAELIQAYSGLVYEAHSTDYQTRQGLQALARDHFAILKVGPALTFALREALFALASMENELISDAGSRSNLAEVLDNAMLQAPGYWRPYYPGDEQQQHFARKYSLSDRSRYYWGDPRVQNAIRALLTNLSTKSLPLTLISQYSPLQYAKIRSRELTPTPQAIIDDRVRIVLEDYEFACGM